MTEFTITNEELYTLICAEDVGICKEFGDKEGIAQRLCSDIHHGISEDDNLTLRRVVYGINKYPEKPPKTWLELFLDAFGDIAIIILAIAAVVALTAGIAEEALGLAELGWIEGIAIIIAVIIVASVGATNDVLKDRKFQALRDSTEGQKPFEVIRGGKLTQITISEICVGDVIFLPPGSKIPADGLFVETEEDKEISVDMSNFNGESLPRKINNSKPFMISGTEMTEGKCNMLVLAVGARSSYGRLSASLINDEDDETPLQAKLEDMVVLIGWIGLGFAIAVFIVLMAYYIDESVVHPHKEVECIRNETEFWDRVASLINTTDGSVFGCPQNPQVSHVSDPWAKFEVESLTELLRAFIVSVTIIVVAVPEGLPLAVTISLAYSVGIMLKDNNLVRHLQACETMGGATNICSDKTGTLTQNKMTVLSGYMVGCKFNEPSEIEANENTITIGDVKLSEELTDTVLTSCLYNLDNAELKEEEGKIIFAGNPTECALLVFADKILSASERNYKDYVSQAQKVKKWSFTSAKKRMSTVVKRDDGYRLYCKGASERIVGLCKFELTETGEIRKIDKASRKKFQAIIDEFAENEMRVLGLAYRDFAKNQKWNSSETGEDFETNMVFVGLVGIMDPLRPEVTEAVRKCKRAGITVRMVTGDFKLTAKAIATKCGILTDGIVLEGKEFQSMNDDDIKVLLDRDAEQKLQVLARSSPDDKRRLVELLMSMDEVVAVTGDGTNDAPALFKAHVGLAMNSGTDVAKNAADIVIIDNNFASIVNSVKWGRCVFDNIRKFLQFQLTVNVVALCLSFIGAITKAGTPLTAVQLLWVNLIMDSMAALALGTERPTDSLLYRKPQGMRGKLITPLMWRNIAGQSLYQLGWLCATLYARDFSTGKHLWLPNTQSSWNPGSGEHILRYPTAHYTFIFNIFVLMQLFNEINSRKVNLDKNVFEGFFDNKAFSIVLLITVVLQALIIEFGSFAFMTSGLSGELWGISIAIGVGTLLWGVIIREIKVPLEEWEKTTPDVQ